jgi:hypothetical protein
VSEVQALLDEWLARGARLLHVGRLPLRASLDQARALALELTFDCGVLRFEADADALRVERSEEAVEGSLSADEEEPWWALLGQELCGAQLDIDVNVEAGGAARRARLQFRSDDQNPRFVRLAARDGQLRITSEGSP